MILIPLGVLWGGYTLVWYGYSMLRGPGVGLGDLVNPAKVSKVTQIIKQDWNGSSSSGSTLPANPPSGKNPFTGGPGGPLLPPGIGSNKGPA